MGARISIVQPHNSATLQFQILTSMQMDGEFKKEQIRTPLSGWGHWKGNLGGGWSLRGVYPKKKHSFQKRKPPASAQFKWSKAL